MTTARPCASIRNWPPGPPPPAPRLAHVRQPGPRRARRAGADRPVPQHVDDAHPHRHRRAHRPRPRPRRRLDRAPLAHAARVRRGHRRHRRRSASPRCSSACSAPGRRRGPPVLRPAARDGRRARDVAPRRRLTAGTTGWPTGCRSGCAELPEQFTDERVAEVASALVSGIASVAIVVVLAIAVLVDGEDLLAALPPAAAAVAPGPGRRRRRGRCTARSGGTSAVRSPWPC